MGRYRTNTCDYNLDNPFLKDYAKSFNHRVMSRIEEEDYIKKAKLSFYDDVNDEEKAKYLEYYMEKFPKFRKKYEKSFDEELLNLAIDNSKNYRDAFLLENQSLVLKYALMYIKKCRFLSLMDLIDEGNIGMLIALKKFDVERGFKFSTYATNWIKQCMNKEIIDHDKTIRIPTEQQSNLNKLNNAERELYATLEREPNSLELANASGLSLKRVEKLRDYYENKEVPYSLDMPYKGDDVETMGDFVESKELDFAEQVDNRILFDECLDYLKSKFTPEHIAVLMKHYGFEDGVAYSLRSIAKVLKLSSSTVRRIDDECVKALRIKFNIRK